MCVQIMNNKMSLYTCIIRCRFKFDFCSTSNTKVQMLSGIFLSSMTKLATKNWEGIGRFCFLLLNLCFVMHIAPLFWCIWQFAFTHKTANARMEACCGNIIHYFPAAFTTPVGWKSSVYNYTHANDTPFKQVSSETNKQKSSLSRNGMLLFDPQVSSDKNCSFLLLRGFSLFSSYNETCRNVCFKTRKEMIFKLL